MLPRQWIPSLVSSDNASVCESVDYQNALSCKHTNHIYVLGRGVCYGVSCAGTDSHVGIHRHMSRIESSLWGCSACMKSFRFPMLKVRGSKREGYSSASV